MGEESQYNENSNSLGNQDYKVNDMGTDAAHMYSQLKKIPTTTILTKESDGKLTMDEMIAGIRTRIILVRYNGVIREVVKDEFEEYQDKLAAGLYQPITFFWALGDISTQEGMSGHEYNAIQVQKVIKIVDGSLESFVSQWFEQELKSGDSNKSVRLETDPDDYISPLRG